MGRRLLSTAVLTAALALGAAFGASATASAHPDTGYWDLDEYDTCVEATNDGLDETQNSALDDAKGCCRYSHGVWDESKQDCVAPPAKSEGAAAPKLPRPVPAIGDVQVAPAPTTITVPSGRQSAVLKPLAR
jgi:hypothetical protein